MGFFHKYPYTDLNELNLDWVINMIKSLINQVENFVSLNAIKYADPIQWSIVTQYQKNTVVIDPLTGIAYISVKDVPQGVLLTDTNYWTVVFDLSSFVVKTARNFTNHYEAETTTTATFNSAADDWIIWGDVLYHVDIPITIGTVYTIGTNLTKFTLEDYIGHLADLLTSDKSSIVNAINEIFTNLSTVTTNVNNMMPIVNYSFVTPEAFGAVGDGVTDDTTAIINAADYARDNDRALILAQNYKTSSSCVLEGVKNIMVSGSITDLSIRNGKGYYIVNRCTNMEVVSIKNSTFIMGHIDTLTIRSSEALNTEPNAGIAYNTFVGGFVHDLSLIGILATEWINENHWYGTRMINVSISGLYGHNNNTFEDVTIEGGSITLDGANSNHFRIRAESGYSLTLLNNAINNTFTTTYASNKCLFMNSDLTSVNGNVQSDIWHTLYDKYDLFNITNKTYWNDNNDYTTGKVYVNAWVNHKKIIITPENDCMFNMLSDVACFRPLFRLIKNGSPVLTQSNSVVMSSISFDPVTGYYDVGSNLSKVNLMICKTDEFDQIEFNAYTTVDTSITEFKCILRTIGNVIIDSGDPDMLKSATQPTNATAPIGTFVIDSTGTNYGWRYDGVTWTAV